MIKTIKNKYKKFIANLRIYNLNIALAVAVFTLLVFLSSTSYFYMQAPSTIAYRQSLDEYFKQENAKSDWNRLYKYHGYPRVVVYEEGKTPYFYNKQGIKCSFINPSKEVGLIVPQAEDSAQYDVATLNDKILISQGGF
jgi:hypothetical protein